MGLLEDLWSVGGPLGWAAALHPLLCLLEIPFRAGVTCRGFLYEHGWKRAQAAPLPVVSIGGIEAGGVGKTPLALELMRLAAREGLRPAILSRGYGRTGGAAGHVLHVPSAPGSGDPEIFGDEPVWLAQQAAGFDTGVSGETARNNATCGIWVARRRIDAARAARSTGARLALLDDGLQHRRLRRDGEVVSLAGRHPLANGHLLPAGPLRETARAALARADRIVLSGIEPEEAVRAAEAVRPLARHGTPIFSWRAVAELSVVSGPPPEDEEVFLLAGIAHPERLLASLHRLGLSAGERRFLPDHHAYRPADLRGWLEHGSSRPLVTTGKDWVRLRPVLSRLSRPGADLRVSILQQRIQWNETGAESDWSAWLRAVVLRASTPSPSRAPLQGRCG